MICQKCNNPGVLNSVNGNDFYYCRSCKDEITLDLVIIANTSTKQKSLIFDFCKNQPQTTINGNIISKIDKRSLTFIIPEKADLDLPDWTPLEVPLLDNFNGVDRNLDLTRLAGVGLHAKIPATFSITDFLVRAAFAMCREGANPDLILMHPDMYDKFVMEFGHKVMHTTLSAHGLINAHTGIQFNSAYGTYTVIPDPSIIGPLAYFITSSTWNYDKVLTCSDPGKNGVFTKI